MFRLNKHHQTLDTKKLAREEKKLQKFLMDIHRADVATTPVHRLYIRPPEKFPRIVRTIYFIIGKAVLMF